jgi:PAS domain S-box-containing protein
VTERKEREKRLRLLEAAVEHSPLTVLITEADRLDAPGPKTVYANPTFTEVTGYCRDDIIGQSPRLLQGPDTDPAALDHIRDALEREEPVRQVVCNYKNDGTPYWNDLFIAPVRDEDGAVTHYVSLQQDVTDRIRRKEALERQNDLFAKAQDIANVGAWEYDRRSDEVVLTDEGYRIHGLAPDTGMTPARSIEFYHPDDRPKIRTAFTQALEDGTSYDLELRLIGADGEQRWVHTRGEPQMDDGEVVRIRGTIQDVTERVRQREALEQAKEAAEEADRIKSALLSNMNHEFRTPLTSIISFSELLSREPELAETFAERILGGGKRLLYTLNTVMDFAELEANTVAPTSDPVNVGALARATVHTFSHLVAQKELTVQIHEPDEGLTAPLDEQLLERIFAHLVHNAIKFTEEGTVDIAVRREGPRVCVSVSDSGVGIDPEFLPRAFDEFAQASSGYDRTHEGNGLGLTIVERLVERMDGDVSIDSTPGEGTTVTVRLPVLR